MRAIETARLLLYEVTILDVPFYFELFNSKGWLQFIGDRNVKSIADVEKLITERYLPSFDNLGYGTYTAFAKDTRKPIGCCGFYKRPSLDVPDLGFAFLDTEVGKGYGYETAAALIAQVKKDRSITNYIAFTVKENVASITLLEKLGMQVSGTITLPGGPEVLLVFKNVD
ncbi:MAG: ribosomal-protein-alanine N-acetyltransferase [Planctomycetota bacterium]|jgi:RimJ/RimL family protein N-acetyltransferase|uniref:GNAT family N-acetyltransferase n=1 Tax=Patiriisocius sp. Uisw_047 TaxID=3230969 RepID=UPI0039EC65AE